MGKSGGSWRSPVSSSRSHAATSQCADAPSFSRRARPRGPGGDRRAGRRRGGRGCRDPRCRDVGAGLGGGGGDLVRTAPTKTGSISVRRRPRSRHTASALSGADTIGGQGVARARRRARKRARKLGGVDCNVRPGTDRPPSKTAWRHGVLHRRLASAMRPAGRGDPDRKAHGTAASSFSATRYPRNQRLAGHWARPTKRSVLAE